MFLPIGDTPNPRTTPYITYLLIGANIAVFFFVSLPLTLTRPDLSDPLLLEYLKAIGARGAIPVESILEHVSAYDLFVFRHGFRPADPTLASLFTAMFLHGGWLHLAGNMLFLWIFGDNVEHRLGRANYLWAYLGTGIAATLFFALFVPGSQIPLVGASGAISGVLGFYYLWFPRNKVKTFIFIFPFIMNTFLVPSRLVLGFYLLVDNLIPFLITRGAGAGVAHGAHIGGFVAGLGVAYGIERIPGFLRRRRTKKKEVPPGVEEGRISGFAAADQIARSIRLGEIRQAGAFYFALAGRAERRHVAAGDILAIGDFLFATGDYDRALSLFRQFIAERPVDTFLDRAYLGAGKALIHKPRCVTSAYQYFLAALDVAQSSAVAEEARMHLRAIERLGKKR
jgi:membrane associated rhomboid family serine protease